MTKYDSPAIRMTLRPKSGQARDRAVMTAMRIRNAIATPTTKMEKRFIRLQKGTFIRIVKEQLCTIAQKRKEVLMRAHIFPYGFSGLFISEYPFMDCFVLLDVFRDKLRQGVTHFPKECNQALRRSGIILIIVSFIDAFVVVRCHFGKHVRNSSVFKFGSQTDGVDVGPQEEMPHGLNGISHDRMRNNVGIVSNSRFSAPQFKLFGERN